MKLLLVEDDHRISMNIRRGLEIEGYLVDVAFNGETGLDMALSDGYDVIILDLMLPLLDGLEVCNKLRAAENQTPILMLTAKREVSDKVTGLESGADDYLGKPFAFEELVARIKALKRRARSTKKAVLCVADLELDSESFSVRRAGKDIQLSKKEFQLLEFLVEHKNNTLSKEKLINKVWEFDTDILPNTVEVYIGYLRNKIEKPFKKSAKIIYTVRGFGYKVSDEHL